jgi:multiple sugar transport system permease protein
MIINCKQRYEMLKKKLLPLILTLLALIGCFPIFFLLTSSIASGGELRQTLMPMFADGRGSYVWFPLMPSHPTLQHYVQILLDSPEFFVTLWNSIRITTVVLALQLTVGAPAAWGFARYNFPFKRVLFTIYIILMMMPFQVTMLSNYLVLERLQLLNTHFAISLPVGFSTFPIIIMYRFFKNIPDEITDSAKIDGAGKIRLFAHIALPVGSSGIIAALVLGFLESWNLIEQPLTFLADRTLWPLSMYLPTITPSTAGVVFAASVIGMIPAVLVFLAGQGYLERGIMAVAIKE